MTRPSVIYGNWLSTKTTRGIFVNTDFLDLSPALKIGSVITLNISGHKENWTILGSGDAALSLWRICFTTILRLKQAWMDLQIDLSFKRRSMTLSFNLPCNRSLWPVLSRINFDVLGSQTTTELKETNAAQMDVLIILLLAMVVLIAVVGGLGLAITMSLNVIERTREIGIYGRSVLRTALSVVL